MLHAMTMRSKSSAGLRALRFPLFLLLVLAFAAGACAKGKAGGKGGGFQMPPMPVEVSTVENRTVRDQFHALGGIQADEVIEVTSEISGVVRQLPFREGQPIARGALIARLEDSDLAADAARASAQHEQAKSNAGRSVKLAEQQVISEQALEDSRLALKVAAANEAQARARLQKAHIRAPWSGLAGRRRVSVGAYVKAGDVITELARVNQVRIQFAAPERYMRQLKPGVAVDVSTPAFPNQIFTGRLAVVDPNVDPQSRTVQLVARAANPHQLLKSGMSANVSVTFSERANALMVPDEAVIAEGTQTFVFVVKPDSSVAKTAIVLGTRDSSQVEVVHGLEAGQRVVRAGHQKLFEGAKVMPIPEGAMAAGMGGPGGAAGAPPAGGGKAAGKAGDSTKAAGGSGK